MNQHLTSRGAGATDPLVYANNGCRGSPHNLIFSRYKIFDINVIDSSVMNLKTSSRRSRTSPEKLPIVNGPVKVAVGDREGLSSNSWRFWGESRGDFYIKCRDVLEEVKVSLHASGSWRIAFTQEALKRRPELARENGDRVWERWSKPADMAPGVAPAFHLIFATSELVLTPEMRKRKVWSDTHYIKAAPPGKIVMLTLFMTTSLVELKHETHPSICLGQWNLGTNAYAQLIAHLEDIGTWIEQLDAARKQAQQSAEESLGTLPDNYYFYIWGELPEGSRFIIGAKPAN